MIRNESIDAIQSRGRGAKFIQFCTLYRVINHLSACLLIFVSFLRVPNASGLSLCEQTLRVKLTCLLYRKAGKLYSKVYISSNRIIYNTSSPKFAWKGTLAPRLSLLTRRVKSFLSSRSFALFHHSNNSIEYDRPEGKDKHILPIQIEQRRAKGDPLWWKFKLKLKPG